MSCPQPKKQRILPGHWRGYLHRFALPTGVGGGGGHRIPAHQHPGGQTCKCFYISIYLLHNTIYRTIANITRYSCYKFKHRLSSSRFSSPSRNVRAFPDTVGGTFVQLGVVGGFQGPLSLSPWGLVHGKGGIKHVGGVVTVLW